MIHVGQYVHGDLRVAAFAQTIVRPMHSAAHDRAARKPWKDTQAPHAITRRGMSNTTRRAFIGQVNHIKRIGMRTRVFSHSRTKSAPRAPAGSVRNTSVST